MQSVTELMEWLQATSWAVFIHRTPWAFTTIELVHVFAISLVIGSIAIVDLRLLGIASTKRPLTELAGAVLGVCVAFGVTRYLQSLLYGVRPSDLTTFAGVALLLILVALAACGVPARRAARVDPVVALRYE